MQVDKATRGGNALEGDSVTVKAVKGWVADAQNGDTVLVFTKRRLIDADANKISAAFVIDKTHPKTWDRASYRSAFEDGARDGDYDHRRGDRVGLHPRGRSECQAASTASPK